MLISLRITINNHAKVSGTYYCSIEDRQDKEHQILLYKIDDLFVEVYYHKEHNIIVKFNAFSKNELLDIYLPKN